MTKFEETINEMKEDIAELEKDFSEKADSYSDAAKEKAEELVNKAKDAINNSIDKVSAVIDDIKDDEKLDEFLDRVKAKSKEAVDLTNTKLNELLSAMPNEKLANLYDDVMGEFDKLKESEAFKKITISVKDINEKINSYLEKPEVKDAINKAKLTTINIAEKGVEGLKKVLDVKEGQAEAPKAEETAVQEEPKE